MSNDKDRQQVSWWNTRFGQEEGESVVRAIAQRRISQGQLTAEFEEQLAQFLGVRYVVAASNGSAALLMALLALELGNGDEVIVPNRTWIATAHAVSMTGATPILVDVRDHLPLLDEEKVEKSISRRTKAIIPVHLNGRSANIGQINKIAKKYDLKVVEDAAQALSSKNRDGFLGTQSHIGIFSLSMAKIISTGQGGFSATHNKVLAERLRLIRTHGVGNVQEPGQWGKFPGFNFRITDLQSAIGLVQIKQLPARVDKVKRIYAQYVDGLKDCQTIDVIPVSVEEGEVPVYTEVLCDDRDKLIRDLKSRGIETRPFFPNLNRAAYFGQEDSQYPNSENFESRGLTLPSGPGQSFEDIDLVIDCIRSLRC